MRKMKRILVTGGCGFVGHHFVEHVLRNTDSEVVIWDKLSYASSGFDRLRDIHCFNHDRVTVLTVDFTQPPQPGVIEETGAIDYIVHMGAESHVDNSIADPEPFVMSNVVGTMRMLDYARKHCKELKKFLYFSTDEVFGPAPPGKAYVEWDRYCSSNPYAASKAGGEELAIAYQNTYKLPVIVTHTMNVFGERQHPEKFIPMVIRNVLAGHDVTIHANADCTKAGSRFYIHARNVASAVLMLLDRGDSGEKYNIVGEREVDNLELARLIAKCVGKPLYYQMVDFHTSRPGHDLRYALDGSKMQDSMGWTPPAIFVTSLAKMVEWTLKNPKWLEWSC